MKSATLPSFWEGYRKLDQDVRSKVKKAYRLWSEDPFHPSLRFKCINNAESIWSVRVTLGYRAIGILDKDTVTWFWIGGHDQYGRISHFSFNYHQSRCPILDCCNSSTA